MKLLTYLTLLTFLFACSQLPKKKLSQASPNFNYEVKNDSLFISLENTIKCPLRIGVNSTDQSIQQLLDSNFPLVIDASKDSLLTYKVNKSNSEVKINFSIRFGNSFDTIKPQSLNLPFVNGKKAEIIQGYNGNFSHKSNYSKYALDFNLAEKDTICAAANGVVVGVIEDYKKGGNSKKWRDYANFITIYHPEMNLFTQYVHLIYKGSFVEVGDSVKAEQPIALSGKTGYTNIEHLHFNILKAVNTESGMQSFPIEFKEGYNGAELEKGDWVLNRLN